MSQALIHTREAVTMLFWAIADEVLCNVIHATGSGVSFGCVLDVRFGS